MKRDGRLISGILTILIIAMLIWAGPVQAFTLNLTNDKSKVTKGEQITFEVSLEIEPNENVNYLIFNLEGPLTYNCKFNLQGEEIGECSGIIVEKISEDTEELGGQYGYGTKTNMQFKITLDTSNYVSGIYASSVSVYSDSGKEIIKGKMITIEGQINRITQFSIKGSGGKIDYISDSNLFKSSKIDFSAWTNIHFSERKNDVWSQGKGSLSLEGIDNKGNNFRFSMNLEQKGIIENSASRLYTDNSAKNVFYWKKGLGNSKSITCNSVTYDVNKTSELTTITGQCSDSFNFKISGIPTTLN